MSAERKQSQNHAHTKGNLEVAGDDLRRQSLAQQKRDERGLPTISQNS